MYTPFFSRLFYHHPFGYPWLSSRDFGLREGCAASTCFSSSSCSLFFLFIYFFSYILFLSRRNWPVIRYTHTYRERERDALTHGTLLQQQLIAQRREKKKKKKLERENVMADGDQIVPVVTTAFTLSRIYSLLFPSFRIFQTYRHTHTIQSYNHHMLDIRRENKM